MSVKSFLETLKKALLVLTKINTSRFSAVVSYCCLFSISRIALQTSSIFQPNEWLKSCCKRCGGNVLSIKWRNVTYNQTDIYRSFEFNDVQCFLARKYEKNEQHCEKVCTTKSDLLFFFVYIS